MFQLQLLERRGDGRLYAKTRTFNCLTRILVKEIREFLKDCEIDQYEETKQRRTCNL